MAKEILVAVKLMLNLRMQTRHEPLQLLEPPRCFRAIQRSALTMTHRNMTRHHDVQILLSILNTLIARIAEGRVLLVKQRLARGGATQIGSSGDQRSGQSRITIHANVRLHSKRLLSCLLSMSHFRALSPVFVSRRLGRFDDRRFQDGFFFEGQYFWRQKAVAGGKDSLRQTVFYREATELEQCRCIWCCLPVKVDSNESANRLSTIHRVFDAFVGQR